MNGILFLAVRTSGGVFLHPPRRGRNNEIQSNAMTTAAPIAGTLERYDIIGNGGEVMLGISPTTRFILLYW
jgi:hypothetical protein